MSVRAVRLGRLCLGLATSVLVAVFLSGLLLHADPLDQQTLGGAALLLSGVAATWACLDRARRESASGHVAAYRYLAFGTLVLGVVQGLAYLVLSVQGNEASLEVAEISLVVAMPTFALAFGRLPSAFAGSRRERGIIAGDAVVAMVCMLAILSQLGDQAPSSEARAWNLTELVAESVGFAIIVWLVGRSRYPGLLPAPELALWMGGALLYLVVLASYDQGFASGANPAATLGIVGFIASAWTSAVAAARPADARESARSAAWRVRASRAIPVVAPGLLLLVIVSDVSRGLTISAVTRGLATIALGLVAVMLVLVRLYTERELERAFDDSMHRELHHGTQQPWFRTLVNESSDIVTIIGLGGLIAYQTPSASRVLGFAPGAWTDRPFEDLVHPRDRQVLAAALATAAKSPGQSRTIDLMVRMEPDAWCDTETTITAISDDVVEMTGFVLTTRDVTDRRLLRDKLAEQAETDALTGLANLAALRRQASLALGSSAAGEVAILSLDLDRFSAVNDSLGHDRGDAILALVAEGLVACVRPWDIVARIGGDSYAILVVGLDVDRSVARVQERMRRVLARLTLEGGHEVRLTAAAGFAVNDAGDETAEDLLRNADVALGQARAARGPELVRFESRMHESLLARVKREEELRTAFAQDQFELYLQPIVRLRSREVIGAESLVRWHHPERGLLTAAQFVPDIEELGLVSQLTDWVIGRAVDALVAVRERHPHLPDFEIGFNLGAELAAPRIVEVVAAELARTGASGQGLVVEITETALGEDQTVVAEVLQSLRDLGLLVALDDFGTGYSSLSYLATLPVDFLKIDRAFIADVVGVPSRETLLATIVRLGEALRLPTIGEGVEHESEAEMLLELGCTHAQGYLFGRPMPLSALIDSLPRSGVPADARSLEAAPEPAATAPQVR